MSSNAAAVALLSEEPEFEGFDIQAGQTWMYPTNYPTRDYQFNIIEKALLRNTLVSLPTGLGKTFIAAVIMYNFFRWYPQGKIIFMAPTKPLVKQQVDACYNIMAIPPEVTAELTGAKGSAIRADIWTQKRVFFITPQVLQNDLNTIVGLASKIKCLVFDEAHKAKGNHAYCEVIRRIREHNHKYFRVLALSATPGNSVDDVLEVIRNLLISHLEFRTEESVDVQPYVFQRSLETLVVPLDEKLQQVKDEYLKILEYYTRTLKTHNVIQGNFSTLTKGKIFMTMKDFQQKTRGTGSNIYSEIMRCLNICITLYHAYELLTRHGLRSFYSFFSAHIDKPLLRGNNQLIQIVEQVKNYMGPIPEIELLPDGTYPEVPSTIKFGHPKYYRLQDILRKHFAQSGPDTRVIVFFEYRESVMEAHMLLLQSRPLIRPRIFLGQGSGITQRVQVNVVKAFREGTCNVLLSTSIGEEGLDVGDVDLIVIFDISNKSPIRMVQRMGRTGRKREGRIIVLVTEGKEQQTLKDCLIHKNNISNHVLGSNQLKNGMYPESPRLVPYNIQPKCNKIYITVTKPVLKNSSIKDMFRSISSGNSEPQFSQDIEIKDILERIPQSQLIFNKKIPIDSDSKGSIFYKHIEKQRASQKCKINNSENSRLLVNLLQLSDAKRFNIPSQMGPFSQLAPQKNLKQSDIRSMFLKPTISASQNHFDVFESEVMKTKQIMDQISKEQEDGNMSVFPRELFLQISNYLSIYNSSASSKECRLCPCQLNCDNFCIESEENNNILWIPLDDNVFQNITAEDMNCFTKKLQPNSEIENHNVEFNNLSPVINTPSQKVNNLNITTKFCDISDTDFNNIPFTQLVQQTEKNVTEKTFAFEAPRNLTKILNQYETTSSDVKNVNQFATPSENATPKPTTAFAEAEILEFFKLDSLKCILSYEEQFSQDTVIYSPTIIVNPSSPIKTVENNIQDAEKEEPGSPILSNADRLRRIKRQQLLAKSLSQKPKSPHESSGKNVSLIESPSKFTMNVTKISSTPLPKSDNIKKSFGTIKNKDLPDLLYNVNQKTVIEKSNTIDIDELCDLSMFGISMDKPKPDVKMYSEYKSPKHLEKCPTSLVSNGLSDFCDMSVFDVPTQKNTNYENNISLSDKEPNTSIKDQRQIIKNKKIQNLPVVKSAQIKEINHKNETAFNKLDDFCDDESIFDVLSPRNLTGKISKNEDIKEKQYSPLVPNGLSDFCDISVFDVLTQKNTNYESNISLSDNEPNKTIKDQRQLIKNKKTQNLPEVKSAQFKEINHKNETAFNKLDDFCDDESIFDVLTPRNLTGKTSKNEEIKEKQSSPLVPSGLSDFCDISVFDVLTQKIDDKNISLSNKEQSISKKQSSPISNNLSDLTNFDVCTQENNVKRKEYKRDIYLVPKNKDTVVINDKFKEINQENETPFNKLEDFCDKSIFDVLTQINPAEKITKKQNREKSTKDKQDVFSKLFQKVTHVKAKNNQEIADVSDDNKPNSWLSKDGEKNINTKHKEIDKSKHKAVELGNTTSALASRSSNSIDELCDLSMFNIPTQISKNPVEAKCISELLDASQDIIDVSIDLDKNPKNTYKEVNLKKKSKINDQFDKSNTDIEDVKIHDSSSDIIEDSFSVETNQKPSKPVRQQDISAIVDLTQDSPEKSLPQYSQMSITQMLSFINKTQKESTASHNKTESVSNDTSIKHPTQTKQSVSSTPKNSVVNLSILNDPANYEEFNSSFNISHVVKKFEFSTNNRKEFDHSFNTPHVKKIKLSMNKNMNQNSDVNIFTQQKKSKDKADDLDPYKSLIDTSKLNLSMNKDESLSDDEFEMLPKRGFTSNKPKHLPTKMAKKQSEDFFVKPSCSNMAFNRKKKIKNCALFIEEEAELSEEDTVNISEDESEEDLDQYEKSFLADETQYVDTQMHVKYLESVRTPRVRGQFKIPSKPRYDITNVYSQVVSNEDNTYLDDSFCVDEDEIEEVHELSELEILEKKLKERKKKKRKKSDEEGKPPKRKRIKVLSSDESD